MSSVSKEFIMPNDLPVCSLDCGTAFKGLTKQEKMYAHYLSQASWVGSLIVLLQTSPESPIIFTLLHKIYSAESIEELKKKALSTLSEEELKAIFAYSCGFLCNSGNYKGFGDSKFIPNLPVEKFEAFVKGSKAYETCPSEIGYLWQHCKSAMYNLADNVKSLGFPGQGVTTYFSSNYSPADVDCVTNLMAKNRVEGFNNRTVKISPSSPGDLPRYQGYKIHFRQNGPFLLGMTITFSNCTDVSLLRKVLLASVEEGIVKSMTDDEMNVIFEIVKGDYSPLLKGVNENLLKAKTYIGFIETYRDPQGSRAEFEGFVALVNKEMSKKFTILVDRAEEFLPNLPWPAAFEKDQFLQPDFTSLDVLTFGGSGVPAGINIPNYDEVRQNDGFKNVHLGNALTGRFNDLRLPFLSEEDRKLVNKYSVQAFEVQVGLHELLGHGTGKLFHRAEDGSFDFDRETVIDPLSGKPISSWYEPGENYDSLFAALGSSYEECRAECVGLIFVPDETEAKNVTYVNWLQMLVRGFDKALEMYQPSSNKWLQAHCQANFVISRVLLEAGDELMTVTETVPNEKLLITLHRDKIYTKGAEALRNFMLKLQVYKSTANQVEAQKLYDKYSEVSECGPHPWKRWRSIIMKHIEPRRVFVQSNTVVKNDDVELKTYEASVEGVITSWVERFPDRAYIYSSLLAQAERSREHFKY
ncbi:hypothetical protein ACP70R_050178 [Stipagrostis hirtigluma subsp. patula]